MEVTMQRSMKKLLMALVIEGTVVSACSSGEPANNANKPGAGSQPGGSQTVQQTSAPSVDPVNTPPRGGEQRTGTAAEPGQAAFKPKQTGEQELGGGRQEAEATFVAAPGVAFKGDAELKEVAGGVEIEVDVDQGPAGRKGIHIHQKGDCSDVPGKSMGEHYTAMGEDHHGLPTAQEHHLGDLGNIQIQGDGEGKLKIVVPGANLIPGKERSFVGKAIVVHETTDVGTQPSGQSGKPIACAVIRHS